jgi:hypothetical protein
VRRRRVNDYANTDVPHLHRRMVCAISFAKADLQLRFQGKAECHADGRIEPPGASHFMAKPSLATDPGKGRSDSYLTGQLRSNNTNPLPFSCPKKEGLESRETVFSQDGTVGSCYKTPPLCVCACTWLDCVPDVLGVISSQGGSALQISKLRCTALPGCAPSTDLCGLQNLLAVRDTASCQP